MGAYQHKTAIIAVMAMVLMSIIAIRADAQTTTTCDSFWLDTNVWIYRDITPWQCGVPAGAQNIRLKVVVTGVSGNPVLTVSQSSNNCSLSGTFLSDGAECTVFGTDDSIDNTYTVELDELAGGAVGGTLTFIYDGSPGVPLFTPTPNPNATPTPTPAGTVTPTPTAIGPTPTLPNFNDPNYGAEPTAIPGVSFPAVVSFPPTPPPPVETTPTLVPIQTNLTLTYPTPAIITQTQELTIATGVISGMTGLALSTQSTISDIVSYTNYLSATLYQATLATDELPNDHAPDWYAPALPRPMADVGWRFELMSGDVRKRYSIAEWGTWVAQLLALPVQFIKGLSAFAQLMGPFGLLLGWLLVMFPVVLLFKLLDFIKQLLIQIFNFVVEIIRLIGDIWDLFPFA